MTTYTYSKRAPTDYTLRLRSNSASFASVLTGAIQTISRPGERWELECRWENLHGDYREDVLAFFVRLNGGEHRVRLPIWNKTNRGELGGTITVDGAGQTGATIDLTGAGTQIGWIKAGDIITWDNGIYMATADADSSAGAVTVPIMPKIRTSPANGASVTVTASAIRSTFILTSPVELPTRPGTSNNPLLSDLTLTFVEDIVA